MKNYLPYAVAAALTLVASTFLSYFTASMAAEESDFGSSGIQIAAADIERATEQAFEDFQAERLMNTEQASFSALGPLKHDLKELRNRQAEINDRIDAILNGDLKVESANAAEDIEIPGDERVDELVSMAIVKFRDDQEKEKVAREKKAREARSAKRRSETIEKLTARLGLSPAQAQDVTNLMIDIEVERSAARARMREARAAGGDFDFRAMTSEFRKLGDSATEKMNNILSPSQQTSYEEFKKEDPWGSSITGFGGMRQMFRGGGQRGNRGDR